MLTLERLDQKAWRFQSDWPLGADTHLDEALDLMAAGKLGKAEKLLRDVLVVCPDHIDVWHHLALVLDEMGDSLLSYACTREAVRLGLNAIPKEFSWLTSLLEWSVLDNRPFLRAYHTLGLYLLEHGRADEALEVLSRLLAVSPNDNLGVRYLLLECLLTQEDWRAAIHLANRYSEDTSPSFSYSKVIALLGLNEDAYARECLQEAVLQHPRVARELSKLRHIRPKSSIPGTMIAGGEDEAFSYWERNKAHWTKDSRAYELLLELRRG